jgi:hypothetical protein
VLGGNLHGVRIALVMSPCDEYKKLLKEWRTARDYENYWRPENRNVHQTAPDRAKEQVEHFREEADNIKRCMEQHVRTCNACLNS